MKPISAKRCGREGDAGYALVMMMFFLALLVLSVAVAAPTVFSNIQREKEAEMVWRGKQYVRGIRMFYMKVHRFPTSLDELTKPTNGIRFMRQTYKDPMNTTDGSWRLIYVGPSGQLVGSLNQQTLGTFGAFGGALPAAGMQQSAFGGATAGGAGSLFGGGGFGASAGGAGAASATAVFTSQTVGQTGGSSTGQGSSTDPNAQNPNSSDDTSNPQPLATMDASNTIGGNIIGVGSKVNKRSFLWYQKAKNYRQFEFIWDPSKDMRVGAASQGIGTPAQNMSGSPGAPGTSSSPFSTGQSPQPGQNTNPNIPNPDPNLNPPLQAPPNP